MVLFMENNTLLTSQLKMVKGGKFLGVKCDFYVDEDGNYYMTRNQLGTALQYSDPQKAVDNLHKRNSDRLDKFSVTVNLRGADNKNYDTTLYIEKGIYDICRYSRQPIADDFYDWVYDKIQDLRKKGYSISEEATVEQKRGMKFDYDMLDITFAECPLENANKLYEECIKFHEDNNTKLEYQRASKDRRSDKLKTHADSKIEIMRKILKTISERKDTLNVAGLREVLLELKGKIEVDIKKIQHNKTKGKLAQSKLYDR